MPNTNRVALLSSTIAVSVKPALIAISVTSKVFIKRFNANKFSKTDDIILCNSHRMVAHYIKALLSSFDFEGRMDRRAFWYFMLATTLISLLAFASDATPIIDALTAGMPVLSLDKFGEAGKIVTMVHAVPIFSANVRRLRDTGRSFDTMLFVLVPIIGQVALLAWLLEPSETRASGQDHRQTKSEGKTNNWSDHVLR